jgi:hypothetical protein
VSGKIGPDKDSKHFSILLVVLVVLVWWLCVGTELDEAFWAVFNALFGEDVGK